MYIKQFYTNCLAEAAYYIESNGEVAIVDPMRDVAPYFELAESRNAKIKYVLETHFHADFISGHLDIARHSSAAIIYGPEANPDFDIVLAKDREQFPLGNIKIEVLHTPGHTMESSCFLLYNEHDEPYALFSGDTLFVGDVGRPDLAVSSAVSKEALAGMLYDSLQEKVMTLADNVIVYPGHGAGSQCGKNLSDQNFSTIGIQRRTNYALQAKSKEEFIQKVTDGILAPPKYFPKDAAINKAGYADLEEILDKNVVALDLDELDRYINHNVVVLDARPPEEFALHHIPGSLSIGLDGFFAVWAGTLIDDLKSPIVLVTPVGQERDTIIRLSRVGFENVLGYVEGGIDTWLHRGEDIAHVASITAKELREKGTALCGQIIDVRRSNEFDEKHMECAVNFPLDSIETAAKELQHTTPYYLYCQSGYRSMIAASVLKRCGIYNTINVTGGLVALEEAGIPIVEAQIA